MGEHCFFQVLIAFYVTIQSTTANFTCNTTEVHLSNLLNSILKVNELPLDLLILTTRLNNSNSTLKLHNCSEFLTLELYLHNHITTPLKNDLPKTYYIALLAYVEIQRKIRNKIKYVPTTDSDILSLINAFASAYLNPYLEQKVMQYFSLYKNWTGTLNEGNFPFDKYENPRNLLLDMICALVKNSAPTMYEREAILFLIVNQHFCSFLRNLNDSKWHLEKETSAVNYGSHYNNGTRHTLKLPLINHNYTIENFRSDDIVLRNDKSNDSSYPYDIILSQNVTATVLHNSSFGKTTRNKLFLNITVFNIIKLKRAMHVNQNSNKNSTIMTKQQNSTNLHQPDSFITMHDHQPVRKITVSHPAAVQVEAPLIENISALATPYNESTGVFVEEKTSRNRSYSLETLKEERLGEIFVVHSQQDGSKIVEGLTVWDIVEMEGPCKEGQQHVVKLNPHSLLTAIDEDVSNSSLQLFLKLLPNVTGFPIEDYNARGQLLRDLLPAIAKQQTDPVIRQKIEEILDHVILDGPGALPLKIKLECGDVLGGDTNKTSRRTRHIFSFQYN